MTFLVGFSIWFSTKTMVDVFGKIGALIYMILAIYVIAPFTGTFMSEVPGFIYANIAWALLLRGFSVKSFPYVCSGIFMLGIALSVRAGALFVLPVLVIVWFFLFKEQGKRLYFKFITIIFTTVFSLLLSPLLLNFIGPNEEYSYQGNFSYVLYGIASGGKGWTFVKEEHPEIFSDKRISDGEKSKLIYSHALKKIKNQPTLFAHSLFNTSYHIVRHPFKFTYKFKFPFPLVIFFPAFIVFWFYLLLGKDPNKRRGVLLIAAFWIGVFISAPFLVDGGERVFIVTMTASCAMLAAGTAFIFGYFIPFESLETERESAKGFLRKDILAIAISIFIITISPLFLKILSSVKSKIAEEDLTIKFRYNRSSALPVKPNFAGSVAGRVLIRSFGIDSVETGSIFMSVMDLTGTRDNYYVYFEPEVVPKDEGIVSAKIVEMGKEIRGNNIYKVVFCNNIDGTRIEEK
jgi:hypothetical protein